MPIASFKNIAFFTVLFALFFFSNCKPKSQDYEPTYSANTSAKKVLLFGVPTQSYYEICDLFVKYLNDHLDGAEVQTVAQSNFLAYMDKLDNRYFHFTVANGMKGLQCARNGYSIIGSVMDKDGYAGAILINKDSSINTFSDLRGKTIATPGYPALAGHMLQMVYLAKKGIDVNKGVKFIYVESFESVFLNIYLGRSAAGFTTTTSWNSFIKRRPEIASKVALKWITPPIIGNAVLLRNDVDKKIADQLKHLVLSAHTTEEGRKALAKMGYAKFQAADTSSYQPIKDFLNDYNALVVDPKR